MIEMLAGGIAVLAAITCFAYLRSGRTRLYSRLSHEQQDLVRRSAIGSQWQVPSRNIPAFDQRIAQVPGVLPEATWRHVCQDAERLGTTERSYLPAHKKGGTVAYDTLCQTSPNLVALYLSPELRKLVSDIVGVQVQPTPLHDQSSCSVLIYEKPGDHIGWHYDHNFYRGRHFTVLLPIVNRGHEPDGLSAAKFTVKRDDGETVFPTPPNSLLVFEGAKVLHRATPIKDGERRVVLSMTYCTDPRNTVVQGIVRRVKDTAYYGIRALWT